MTAWSARAALLSCLSACSFDVVDFADHEEVDVFVVGDIPQATLDQFANATDTKPDDKQAAFVYPNDGAVLPVNLPPLHVSWSGMMPMMLMIMPADAHAYQLRLLGAARELRIYTTALDADPPVASWSALAQSGTRITLELRTLMPGPKGKVVLAATRDVSFRTAPPTGTLYYATDTGVHTATLDAVSNAPLTVPSGVTCTQGHAVSRDGARFGIACSNGTGAIWNLRDGSVVRMLAADPDISAFGAFEPNGTRYVRERAGQLEIVDVTTGNAQMLTAGHQPDWSPSGSEIAFSVDAMPMMGGLARVRLDPLTQTFGAPEALNATGASNPSYSPDGRWLAYQSGDKLGSVQLLSTQGGMPVAVMMNGAPTWLPGADARTAWLVATLNATADGMSAPAATQLWLSAVDLATATVHPPVWLPFQDPLTTNTRALFAP